jgi:hypothetical protein
VLALPFDGCVERVVTVSGSIDSTAALRRAISLEEASIGLVFGCEVEVSRPLRSMSTVIVRSRLVARKCLKNADMK